jgi:hypothetical protein
MDNEERLLIHRAAAWLDDAYPGWAETIDVSDFDMADDCRCIGGYLRVDWDYDLKRSYQQETGRDGTGLFSGFDSFWLEEIERRIPARAGTW